MPDTKPDPTLSEQWRQTGSRILLSWAGGLKEINTRIKSLGGLGKKEPLETVVREDLLIKSPLCRGLNDEKEQVMNNLGQALPNPVR